MTFRVAPFVSQTTTTDLSAHIIAEGGFMQSLVDGVNEVAFDEALFEFGEDRLRIGCVDPANVMMSEQIAAADGFEHYEVDRPFAFGMNTEKVEDLLKIAGKTSPVEFDLEWERRTFKIRFEDVEYDLPGIDTESVTGTLKDMPDRSKAEYNYEIRATVPVDGLMRATKIVGLAKHSNGIANFVMAGEDPIFEVGGDGDTDASKVKIHDDEDFAWVRDPPKGIKRVKLENGYLSTIPKLMDTDTVYLETGIELPAFFEADRYDGAIESTFAIAPRITN